MRILNCCTHDWANLSYENCQALKSIGVDAHSIKTEPHKLKYINQSRIVNRNQRIKEIERADLIQIMHSDLNCLQICKDLNKITFVHHTGSGYRAAPKRLNDLFNPFVERAFTDQTEFIGLGMKDEYYLTCPVNTEKIKSSILVYKGRIIFGHYPSAMNTKGTYSILYLLEEMKLKYSFSHIRVMHSEQLKRMNLCHVYIELFKPILKGKKYGCFGVTALEAASLGKLVITGHTTPEVYKMFYGTDTPFVTPQTEIELHDCIQKISVMDPIELYMKRLETRMWVEKYHSYKATGRLNLSLIKGNYSSKRGLIGSNI